MYIYADLLNSYGAVWGLASVVPQTIDSCCYGPNVGGFTYLVYVIILTVCVCVWYDFDVLMFERCEL